jgi:hypothetical protein
MRARTPQEKCQAFLPSTCNISLEENVQEEREGDRSAGGALFKGLTARDLLW